MAYLQPDQQNPTAAPQATQNAPISAGGAGVSGSSKPKDVAAPAQPQAQQPSSQLSAYLNANAPQANIYAGQIAPVVGGQVQAAGNAIDPAVNSYTGSLNPVATDTTVNQQVATAPSGLTDAQQATYEQELGAANNVPNSANTFETTSGYQNAVSQVEQAVEQANLWNSGNSVPNLTTALSPFESSNATTGDMNLDTLLLSQTPDAYSQITNAVAPAANLPQQLVAGATTADTALQNAIAQDIATTQAAQAASQTYANNLTQYLQDQITANNAAGAAQNATILADLKAGTPTAEDLSTLGITSDQWNTLSGEMAQASKYKSPIDLSQYLTQTAPNATDASVATPTQYADIAALQKLLGGNAPVEPITSVTANQAATTTNTFDLQNAETAAQLAPLEAQGKAIVQAGKVAEAGYQQNHFGGMSPGQFNDYINNLNAELRAINKKISGLDAANPGFKLSQTVGEGDG